MPTNNAQPPDEGYVRSSWLERIRRLLGWEEPRKMRVCVSRMKRDALLKIFETEWQDHFQTRSQTWQALQIAAVLTVAIVGIRWKTTNPLVGVVSSLLLMGVSLLGMQITFRHRNQVEVGKFTVICAVERELGFESSGHRIPSRIRIRDIFKLFRSCTSLFLLRMQGIIFLLSLVMLGFSIYQYFCPSRST